MFVTFVLVLLNREQLLAIQTVILVETLRNDFLMALLNHPFAILCPLAPSQLTICKQYVAMYVCHLNDGQHAVC